ncbi:zinc transporter ZntB [Sphingomonas sp. BIUV-7]|uniref:Zinc transporter ZntB n=1 Tax=Sphingomonas natans TaxID=3063330 RepID=A0ABT8YC57_9SPHN|nr:zinc transporter ZntB [Sphingomonas sp. BIUV-7]MDO6415914.1 zinc transporter ZntB [Sphingomonas sp. BIUV-7]
MTSRFAIELGADGKGHAVEPAAACRLTPDPARLVWVHLDGREAETLGWLREHGGMPETVVYALTAIETRPRCEAIAEGALVNLRGPAETPDDGDPLVSIRLWLEQGRVISVSYRPIATIHVVREQMEQGQIKDPGDFVSHIAMLITKRIDPTITELGDLVDDCETMLEPDQAYETRRKIATARSDAIVYRRFIVPQREALTTLSTLEVGWLEEDDRLHLREAADRFARMAEELESVRERSALIHEQLTDLRSEQIENRALLISVVALIFLPLTFLTGLLGMNVDGIPFAHEPWAFAAVTALCGLVALSVGGWFAAQHWFGR